MVAVVYTLVDGAVSHRLLDDWLAGIGPARRRRIERMRAARDRRNSLLGLQLLRRLLAQTGWPDFDLARVEYPPGDKPRLPLPVDFSISHSGDLIACAVSTESSVGIDVEALDRPGPIPTRVLTLEENRWVGDDRGRFLACWTRKEAALKCFGTRLAAIGRIATEPRRARLGAREAWLRPLSLAAGYVAHVATERPEAVSIEALQLTAAGLRPAPPPPRRPPCAAR